MHTSQLDSSGDRFLSICLQNSLEEGWLSPSDISTEFPPSVLMEALESADDLRANLLVEAAGVHKRIAPKKSITAAAEDLQIALDEGICTPETILNLVPVDDLVRYLDAAKLWDLFIRDEFWLDDNEDSRARMLGLLEVGFELDLIDLPRLIAAITPERLANDLPREALELVFAASVQSGLDGSAFDPARLTETIPLSTWLESTSVAHFWTTAVAGEIAPGAGFTAPNASAASTRPKKSSGEETPVRKVRTKKKKRSRSANEEAAPAAAPAAAHAVSDAERQARARAMEKLRQLERLPTDAESLRSPVLLGMEAMYGDFLKATSDDDRQECLEDGFPNPKMLNEALIAMCITLDPRLTPEELESRGADNDSLIQLVLFEERRRANRAAGISPSAPPAIPVSPSPSPIAATAAPIKAPAPPVGAPGPKKTAVPPLPQQAQKASSPPPPLPNRGR